MTDGLWPPVIAPQQLPEALGAGTIAAGGTGDQKLTVLDNLVLLCRRHHVMWHQGRLQLHDLHVPWLTATGATRGSTAAARSTTTATGPPAAS